MNKKIFYFKENKKYELYLSLEDISYLFSNFKYFKQQKSIFETYISLLFIPFNQKSERYITVNTLKKYLNKSKNQISNDLRYLSLKKFNVLLPKEKLEIYRLKEKIKKYRIYKLNNLRQPLKENNIKYKKEIKIKLYLDDLKKHKDIRLYILYQFLLAIYDKKEFMEYKYVLRDLLNISDYLLRKTIKIYFNKQFVNYPLIGNYSKKFGKKIKNKYKTIQIANVYYPLTKKYKPELYNLKNKNKKIENFLLRKGNYTEFTRRSISSILGTIVDSFLNKKYLNKMNDFCDKTSLLYCFKNKNVEKKYCCDYVPMLNNIENLFNYS